MSLGEIAQLIKSQEAGPKLTSTLDVAKAAQLIEVRQEIKRLQALEKDLKGEVDGYFRNFTDPDSMDVPSETFTHEGVTYLAKWGRQDRSKLDPDKIRTFLVDRGMWDELSREERVLDEEAFKSAISEGIISLEEVQSNCMKQQIVRTVEVKAIK